MLTDQRKKERFETGGEIYAAFVVPNSPVIVGRVLDISEGGAGFRYISTTRLERGPVSIKLFGLNSRQMEQFDSRVVYDLEVSSYPRMRRCGIKFETRGPELLAKLRKLTDRFERRHHSEKDVPSAVKVKPDKDYPASARECLSC